MKYMLRSHSKPGAKKRLTMRISVGNFKEEGPELVKIEEERKKGKDNTKTGKFRQGGGRSNDGRERSVGSPEEDKADKPYPRQEG